VTHPEFVRVCLAHFRERGETFTVAWTRTLQSLPRGTTSESRAQRDAWVAALKWSRPAWEAAYALPPAPGAREPDAEREEREQGDDREGPEGDAAVGEREHQSFQFA
jgi:hypothetical protein